jgi:uncharacterized membrane protein YagU involved in acid resistance
MWKRRKPKTWKGVVAGVTAGLVATWTMNQFQAAVSKLGNQKRRKKESDETATVKAAELVSEKVLHRRLSRDEKQRAGNVVHYAYGAAVGGVYGALAERKKPVRKLAGVPYGVAVWLLGDEIAVPALRLSKGPTEYPVSVHAKALASHIVYAATANLVWRTVRTAI